MNDSEEARKKLQENDIHGFHQVFALESAKKALSKIDIYHPLKFEDGESVNVRLSGGISGAIVLSLASLTGIEAAKLGVAGGLQGEFGVNVMKLDGKKVLVDLSVLSLGEKGVFTEVARVFGASAAKSLLKSINYQLVFDFDVDGAEDDYKEFVETGHIRYFQDPQAMKDKAFKKNMNEAQRILGAMRKDGPLLARRGIAQSYFSAAISPAHKNKISAYLTPWHEWSKSVLKANPTVVETNGEEAMEYKTWQMEIAKRTLRSGDESRNVYASVKTVYRQQMNEEGREVTSSYPDGITLRAEFNDSKVLGNEHNGPIQEINHLFGRILDYHTHKGKGENLKLSLEKTIYPEDINTLLAKSLGEGSDAIKEAAARTGISAKVLSNLVSTLNHQGQDEQAMEILKFINDLGTQGLDGLAAIHLLLGGRSESLAIKSENSAQVEPVEEASKFTATATVGEGKQLALDQSAAYFKQGGQIIAKLEHGVRSVDDDPTLIKDDEQERSTESKFEGMRNFARPKMEALVRSLETVEKMMDIGIPASFEKSAILKEKDKLKELYKAAPYESLNPLQKALLLVTQKEESLINPPKTTRGLFRRQRVVDPVASSIAELKEEIAAEESKMTLIPAGEEKKISSKYKLLKKFAPEVFELRLKRLKLASELLNTLPQ
ncbi:MAG: hypothetical protein HQK50_12890 [Oligoflexia bacterium]|nr:hypothetical protein [Oligoflexia bacterium]